MNSQTFTLLWWKKCVKLAKNVKKVINKGIGTCFSENIVVFGHILAEISEAQNLVVTHTMNFFIKHFLLKIKSECSIFSIIPRFAVLQM